MNNCNISIHFLQPHCWCYWSIHWGRILLEVWAILSPLRIRNPLKIRNYICTFLKFRDWFSLSQKQINNLLHQHNQVLPQSPLPIHCRNHRWSNREESDCTLLSVKWSLIFPSTHYFSHFNTNRSPNVLKSIKICLVSTSRMKKNIGDNLLKDNNLSIISSKLPYPFGSNEIEKVPFEYSFHNQFISSLTIYSSL